MANFWKKAFGAVDLEDMDYVGDDTTYQDDPVSYDQEDEAEEYEAPVVNRRTVKSNVIEMDRSRRISEDSKMMQMIIFKPRNHDEIHEIVNNLKERKPVIINLDKMDTALAQRILDFVHGAVYALNGDLKRVARNIFVVVPSNIDIETHQDGDSADAKGEEMSTII